MAGSLAVCRVPHCEPRLSPLLVGGRPFDAFHLRKYPALSFPKRNLTSHFPEQWRYILYFTLLTLELRLILSPSPSPSGRHITLLHRLFPNRVIYQHILFLHQVFMFLNVALMRVTPHLIERDELDDPRMEAALVERTVALVNLADRESAYPFPFRCYTVRILTAIPSNSFKNGSHRTPIHSPFR